MSQIKTLNDVFNPDPASGFRFKIDPVTKEPQVMTGDDYVKLANEIKINNNVPLSIKNLFDEAKTMYCHGYLEHRFFTLALEKTIFAFESSVEQKYKKIRGPKKTQVGNRPNFEFMINYLIQEKILNPELELFYHGLRKERNNIAHNKSERHFQTVDLTMAYQLIQFLCGTVNTIFKEESEVE